MEFMYVHKGEYKNISFLEYVIMYNRDAYLYKQVEREQSKTGLYFPKKQETSMRGLFCCLTRTRTQTDRTRICSATITPLGTLEVNLPESGCKDIAFF